MQNHEPTFYAYLRVSTDRQDVDNQRHGVTEYAKQNGFGVLTFIEDTVSGKKEWRDRGLGKLLNGAKTGDILIVAEISRVARSTLQVLEVLKLAAEKGITVHIAKNRMVVDGSLNNRLTVYMLGIAGEIEREFISARTTEALARRKAAGLPVGRQKGSTNESKKLDKHAAMIREYLELGVSKQKIMEKVECCERTLYEWMYANDLGSYIKSRSKNEKPAPAPVVVPLIPARAKRGGGAKPKARAGARA